MVPKGTSVQKIIENDYQNLLLGHDSAGSGPITHPINFVP
jgi:hypothetical protein